MQILQILQIRTSFNRKPAPLSVECSFWFKNTFELFSLKLLIHSFTIKCQVKAGINGSATGIDAAKY